MRAAIKKYSLNHSVFMVNGYKAACLYDLRSDYAKIYRLDEDAKTFVSALLGGEEHSIQSCEETHSALSLLVSNNLIVESDITSPHDDSPINNQSTVSCSSKSKRAWIEVTSGCQLKCVYCYGEFGRGEGSRISESDINTIANELEKNGYNEFHMLGGEPLLAIDALKSMIISLKKIESASFEILTNGLLINNEFIVFCKEHSVRLAVTIFGANEEECFAVTGSRGIFERQRRIISKLESSGIKYRLSITRTALNCSQTLEVISKSLGLAEPSILREDIARTAGRAIEDGVVSGDLARRRLIVQSNFERPILSATIRRYMSGHSCFSDKICITSGLDVYPCIMERGTLYGNLKTKSLSSVLEAGKIYSGSTKDSIDVCRDCEYRYACFDCRPLRKSDGFFSQPSNCSYDPYNEKWENIETVI